jgi:hypothetical protein
MQRPYRNITKGTDMEKTPQTEWACEKRRSSRTQPLFSRSTLINFSAIALLFAIIFALQQLSASFSTSAPKKNHELQAVIVDMEELEAKAAQMAHAEPVQAMPAALQAVPEKETPTVAVQVLSAAEVRAAEQKTAPAVTEETYTPEYSPAIATIPTGNEKMASAASASTDPSPTAATSQATASGVPTEMNATNAPTVAAAEKKSADIATPEKPREVNVSKRTRRNSVHKATSRYGTSDPYWQDKQVSVEELDTPHARAQYRALNSDLYARSDQQRPATPTSKTSAEAPAYQPSPPPSSVHDLDGAAARQRYRAETENLLGRNASN